MDECLVRFESLLTNDEPSVCHLRGMRILDDAFCGNDLEVATRFGTGYACICWCKHSLC